MNKVSISLIVFVLAFALSFGVTRAHEAVAAEGVKNDGTNIRTKARIDLKTDGRVNAGRVIDVPVKTDGVYGEAKFGVDGRVETASPKPLRQPNFFQSKVLPFFNGDKTRDSQVRDDDRAGNLKLRFELSLKSLLSIHTRLSTLASRIEERAKKLEASGISTIESRKFLTAAQTDLKNAKLKIDAASASFRTETDVKMDAKIDSNSQISENVSTYVEKNFKTTHANIQSAKELLKSAHRNLMAAVTSFKPGLNKDVEASVNTSATVETTQ